MSRAFALVCCIAAAAPATAAAEEAAYVRGAHSITRDGISPVEVIRADELRNQGYTTLPQILANLVPSFVYPEPALALATDHVRPASLRGLAPDQMVVLLDGKRRNPAAWLHRSDTFGRGSVGVDLSVVPLAAVERIEILRDGASARYGSGAIAGVINVVLKDADDGGSLVTTFGQYRTHLKGVPDLSTFVAESPSSFFLFERADLNTDDGEGDTLTVSAHGGFDLFERGYLDLSAEFRDQEPTNRSGFDHRAFYPALPNGDFDPREAFVDRRNHRYGNPEQEDVKLLANFGLPFGDVNEFYGHIGYTARNAESAGLFVLPRSDANVPAIHPDGYLPLLASDDENRYFTFGFRGERWGWTWDLSYTSDEHEMDFSLDDSLNPSLGEISPTSFEIGNWEGRHVIGNLDVGRELAVGLAGPLSVTWGLEFKDAEYENEFGDRAAFVGGGARTEEGVLRPPGSQGLVGVRPLDNFDSPRTNLAAYVELAASVTETFHVLAGARLDDEEEESEVSGRLGARWQATDRLAVRGTVSRNFRHPSPAQTFFRETGFAVAGGGYDIEGTFPADDPVAEALGAEPLDSETAVNVNLGAELRLSEAAAVSVDVYRIDIDDRIVLSSFLSGVGVTDALAAAGITNVRAVRYFFNGVDTRTRGVDAAARYVWPSRWGPIELAAGLNVNDADVTGSAADPAVLAGEPDAVRFDERMQRQLEVSTPASKLHLSARWQGEYLSVEARLSRYGEVTDVGAVPEQDLELDPSWLLDLHARYRLTKHGSLGFGIYNMLDEYTEVRPRGGSNPDLNRVLPYSNFAPYGFNGRFVYLRLGVDLN